MPGPYTRARFLVPNRGCSLFPEVDFWRGHLVLGARAVLQKCHNQSPGLRAWLAQLTARTHPNVAIVALANKLARMAWAVLARGEQYHPPMLANSAAG